jgi:hypothetical protein
VIAEPLTSAAFAPFGTVFGSHAAPPDAAGDALVLLPLGTGTDDTVITRFPEHPIRIEV